MRGDSFLDLAHFGDQSNGFCFLLNSFVFYLVASHIALDHDDPFNTPHLITVFSSPLHPNFFPHNSLRHLNCPILQHRRGNIPYHRFSYYSPFFHGFGDVAGLGGEGFLQLEDGCLTGDVNGSDHDLFHHYGHLFPHGFLDGAVLVLDVDMAELVSVLFVHVA